MNASYDNGDILLTIRSRENLVTKFSGVSYIFMYIQ